MKPLLYLILIFFLQETPYKPKDEFNIKLDYKFKQRPSNDHHTIEYETSNTNRSSTSNDLLPYLVLNIELLTVGEATKVQIASNLGLNFSKKIRDGATVPLTIGFTDDVKDRVTAHEYELTFMSSAKTKLSRILITIEKDGIFLVNGETRGKF